MATTIVLPLGDTLVLNKSSPRSLDGVATKDPGFALGLRLGGAPRVITT